MADNRRSISVLQFCQRAKDLLASNQADFVQFVLTGQDPDGSQACIDPIFNRVAPDSHPVAIRDYDSLLGISSQILLVDTNLVVHPISNHEDTLSKNIHIRYEFTTANVRFPCRYIQLEAIDIHACFREPSPKRSTKSPIFVLGSGASAT